MNSLQRNTMDQRDNLIQLRSLLQENITQERSQWERLKLQENNHINQENALIEKQKVILILVPYGDSKS